jgi:hypothetical protein
MCSAPEAALGPGTEPEVAPDRVAAVDLAETDPAALAAAVGPVAAPAPPRTATTPKSVRMPNVILNSTLLDAPS